MRLTDEYLVAEPLLCHWRILLDISFVVVERTILPGLQLICILDHLFVQPVQDGMTDHVLQKDQSVTSEGSDGNFKIALAKGTIFQLRR